MGFKIRAGMAVGGFVLSYFFGLGFLSGIASHLDTTGNILVDIADGIGLVSKGIEALESYIDPSKVEEVEGGGVDQQQVQLEVPPSPPLPVDLTTPTPPKPVICKKGKCAPYDPTKDKVLQQQLIRAERERILQQFQSGSLPTEALVPSALLFDEDELDDDEVGNVVAKRLRLAAQQQQQQQQQQKATTKYADRKITSTTSSTQQPEPQPKPMVVTEQPGTVKVTVGSKLDQPVDILDPTNPQLDLDPAASGGEVSPWKFGAKKILSSVNVVCQRLNNLILKIVAKIFPWNRRAKRRLAMAKSGGDPEALDDEF